MSCRRSARTSDSSSQCLKATRGRISERSRTQSSAVLLLAAGPTTLAAQAPGPVSASDVDELESIIVTATRLPIRAFAVPAMAYSESAADIQGLYQSRTLPEALGEVPGVLVQKSVEWPGLAVHPWLHRLSQRAADRRHPSQQLGVPRRPQPVLEHRGHVLRQAASRCSRARPPCSTAATPSAERSTCSRTFPARRSPGSRRASSTGIRTRNPRTRSAATSPMSTNGCGPPAATRTRVTATLKAAGPWACNRGPATTSRPPTRRVEYELSSRSTLLLGNQYVNQDDAWRTHRTIYGNGWNGTTIGTDRELVFDQQRQLGYVQLRQGELGTFADTMLASASYQSQGEDQHRVRSNLAGTNSASTSTRRGCGSSSTSNGAGPGWMYGADYYGDDVTSYNVEYNADGSIRRVHAQGPVADDAAVRSHRTLRAGDRAGHAEGRVDAGRSLHGGPLYGRQQGRGPCDLRRLQSVG